MSLHVPLEPRKQGVIDLHRSTTALLCLLGPHVDAALHKVNIPPLQAQNLILPDSAKAPSSFELDDDLLQDHFLGRDRVAGHMPATSFSRSRRSSPRWRGRAACGRVAPAEGHAPPAPSPTAQRLAG